MSMRDFPIYWSALLLAAAVLAGLLGGRIRLGDFPSRLRLYAASAANLIVSTMITFGVALWWAPRSLHSLSTFLPQHAFLIWAGSTAGVSLLTALTFHLGRRGFGRTAAHLLPRTGPERFAFLGLCVVTGFCEEYLYRGFAFPVVATSLHSTMLSAAIVTAAFAANHLAQDAIAVLRAFLLGAILIAPVILTGSLWPSIVAHILVNAAVGMFGRHIVSAAAGSDSVREKTADL